MEKIKYYIFINKYFPDEYVIIMNDFQIISNIVEVINAEDVNDIVLNQLRKQFRPRLVCHKSDLIETTSSAMNYPVGEYIHFTGFMALSDYSITKLEVSNDEFELWKELNLK